MFLVNAGNNFPPSYDEAISGDMIKVISGSTMENTVHRIQPTAPSSSDLNSSEANYINSTRSNDLSTSQKDKGKPFGFGGSAKMK